VYAIDELDTVAELSNVPKPEPGALKGPGKEEPERIITLHAPGAGPALGER
jgi:hypothetical protein